MYRNVTLGLGMVLGYVDLDVILYSNGTTPEVGYNERARRDLLTRLQDSYPGDGIYGLLGSFDARVIWHYRSGLRPRDSVEDRGRRACNSCGRTAGSCYYNHPDRDRPSLTYGSGYHDIIDLKHIAEIIQDAYCNELTKDFRWCHVLRWLRRHHPAMVQALVWCVAHADPLNAMGLALDFDDYKKARTNDIPLHYGQEWDEDGWDEEPDYEKPPGVISRMATEELVLLTGMIYLPERWMLRKLHWFCSEVWPICGERAYTMIQDGTLPLDQPEAILPRSLSTEKRF